MYSDIFRYIRILTDRCMTRIPNSARIRSLQSEKEMLVLELEEMKCKPQRLGFVDVF